MKRFRPSPALVISLIALFVALGGTSYAAITLNLPKNSVGTAQIKNGAVTARKISAAAANGFQRSTLPSGHTEVGVWAAWDQGSAGGGYMGSSVTFPVPLAANLPAAKVVFVGLPAKSAAHCPGRGRAASGYLCVYEAVQSNTGYINTFDPSTGDNGISKFGFSIYFNFASAGSAYSYGSWAVTAP